MIALLVATALAGPVRLDRVDLVSEDPGLWLTQEVPRFGQIPSVVLIRWLEQVKPVIATPADGLLLGLSLQTQSLYYERPVHPVPGLSVVGGLQTRALLPRGVLAGVGYRQGPIRVGASLNLLSNASWARPDWSWWTVVPGLGFGVGPARREHAPWMETP